MKSLINDCVKNVRLPSSSLRRLVHPDDIGSRTLSAIEFFMVSGAGLSNPFVVFPDVHGHYARAFIRESVGE